MRGTRVGNRNLPVPPNRNNVRNRNNLNPTRAAGQSYFGARGASIFSGIFSAVNRANQGAGAGEIAFAGGSTYGLSMIAIRLMRNIQNPYVQLGGLILANMGADYITDRVFQGNNMSNIQSQVQDRQLQLRNNSNVVVVDGEENETNITGGAGAGVNDASASINLSKINKAVTGITETVRKSKLLIDDISEKIGKTNERIKTKISTSAKLFQRRQQAIRRKVREDLIEASGIGGAMRRVNKVVSTSTRGFLGRILELKIYLKD